MSIRPVALMLALVSAVVATPVASQGWANLPSGLATNTGPLSRQYYYGCATINSSACIYGAMAQPVGTSLWTLYFEPFTFDDAGKWWQTFDIWGLSDGHQCFDLNDIFSWPEESCQVQQRSELTLYGSLDWVGPPHERISVTLKPVATPEPATMALLAPALLGIGAIARRRERRRQERGE